LRLSLINHKGKTISVPIIQGGMEWCIPASLASAVAQEGGVGIVSAHALTVFSRKDGEKNSIL